MTERRRHPRIPLENMLYVQIVSPSRNLSVVLLDISICGARIGLPPGEELPPDDSQVVFKNTSLLAEILENRTATVMWHVGVQCGVRFVEHLETDLEHIAELLQSEIFY